MAGRKPAPKPKPWSQKKPLRFGTGGAKSLKRSEPSRRAGNGGDDDYDGNGDHGKVGAARGANRRAVKVHRRAVKKPEGRRGVKGEICEAGTSLRDVCCWELRRTARRAVRLK